MDAVHEFSDNIQALGAVSHIRLSIFPDGGISRIRLNGKLA
jgi:allantoicase